MPDSTSSGVRLRSRFADDPEMSDLVRLFISELPARINTLTHAMHEQQLEAMQRMAHQLRGASTGYGFPSIGAAAAKVEDILHATGSSQGENLEQLTSSVHELVELCRLASKG